MDTDDRIVDEALTLKVSDDAPGWYTIERAEHDGRQWFETTEYGMALRLSCRITNACVEGNGADMVGIANAIKDRGEFSARRCAVRVDGDHAIFRSPRNSTYSARVPMKWADALAVEIVGRLDSA